MKLDCDIVYMKTLMLIRKTYPKREFLSLIEYKTILNGWNIKQYMVAKGNKDNIAAHEDIHKFISIDYALDYINKICRDSKQWDVIFSYNKITERSLI